MPATDWIDADAASNLTGLDITPAELEAALPDVTDLMRWTPIFGVDLIRGTREGDRQADAYGRAIAYQAAYRQVSSPEDLLAPRALTGESFGSSYSATYEKGSGAPAFVAKRVRTIVANAGLIHMTGSSRPPLAAMDLGRRGGGDDGEYGSEGPFIAVIP